MNEQFKQKYTDKILLQNKIFFVPTDPTLFGISRWRGNKQYFKCGLIIDHFIPEWRLYRQLRPLGFRAITSNLLVYLFQISK